MPIPHLTDSFKHTDPVPMLPTFAMKQRYILGLHGEKLRSAQIWAVILPSYILFGWNNAVAGPLLSLLTWVDMFPQLDTLHTTGAEETANSRIQGTVVAMYTLGAFIVGRIGS